jgi:hypothetical protein
MYYEDWLNKQSQATQQDILGPARWEMWDKGSVGLTDLVDQKGYPLTLAQLKEGA